MKVTPKSARANVSRLLDAAVKGDDVIITKAGKPCVRFVPLTPSARRPGSAEGRARVTPAYFDPLPEDELEPWSGRRN